MASKLRRLLRQIRTQGFRSTAASIPLRIRSRMMVADDRRFESEYDLDTESIRPISEMRTDRTSRLDHGFDYVATTKRIFDAVVANLPDDREHWTFVDFGCGKGKVLLMACLHGYGRIIGVEFASELVAIANQNVERFALRHEAARAIRVEHQDASQFEIPDGDCVLFFNNPFDESVMRAVLQRLQTAHRDQPDRQICVVYFQLRREPESDRTMNLSLIEACPLLERRIFRPRTWIDRFALGSHQIEIFENSLR